MPGLRPVTAAGLALLLSAVAAAQPPAPAEFVHRAFAHGVPYDDAARYRSAEHQRALVAMLDSSAEQRAWANIVTVLGIIGDREAAAALRNFIARGDGTLTVDEYQAKTAAIFSLGYALNRLQDQETLDYLRRGTRLEGWNDRVRWRSPFSESVDGRNMQLALAAVRALGISGTPQGEQALAVRSSEISTIIDSPFRDAFESTLRDAAAANRQVRNLGLPQFLRQQQNRN